MINAKWKLIAVLGVTAATVLSTVAAEARGLYPSARYSARGAYAQAPLFAPYGVRGAYALAPGAFVAPYAGNPGVGYFGTGTFSDGRRVPGTNWNPNQP